MTNTGENLTETFKSYYQTCRILSGFKQEVAAPELGLADATVLSRIENGKSKAPDDVVLRMVKLYNAPMLGLWHLRVTNPLACEVIPEIYPTSSDSDMYVQTAIAGKQAKLAEDAIFNAMCSGQIGYDDLPFLDDYIKHSNNAVGNLISAKAYALKTKNRLEKEVEESA